MGRTIASVIVFIVAGVMLANVIANPTGTKVVFDGFTSFWKTSVNGLLAKPST